MKEPVGADFIDAKDGLTLIAIEEGGYHTVYCFMLFLSEMVVLTPLPFPSQCLV